MAIGVAVGFVAGGAMRPTPSGAAFAPNDALPFHLLCGGNDCEGHAYYLEAKNLATPTPGPMAAGRPRRFTTWSNMTVNGGGDVGSAIVSLARHGKRFTDTPEIVITIPEANGNRVQSLFLPAPTPDQYVIVTCNKNKVADGKCPWQAP